MAVRLEPIIQLIPAMLERSIYNVIVILETRLLLISIGTKDLDVGVVHPEEYLDSPQRLG